MSDPVLNARPAFITYDELESVLGFRASKPTLYRWMKKGNFPDRAVVPGCRRLMWRWQDIDAWIEQKQPKA